MNIWLKKNKAFKIKNEINLDKNTDNIHNNKVNNIINNNINNNKEVFYINNSNNNINNITFSNINNLEVNITQSGKDLINIDNSKVKIIKK